VGIVEVGIVVGDIVEVQHYSEGQLGVELL
jgi:hypothetical protein